VIGQRGVQPGPRPYPPVQEEKIVSAAMSCPMRAWVRIETKTGTHKALVNHHIKYEYYVGRDGAHDWATWRHLLYYNFLPGLWRN
jgi:enterochelin esterase-like enzyme